MKSTWPASYTFRNKKLIMQIGQIIHCQMQQKLHKIIPKIPLSAKFSRNLVVSIYNYYIIVTKTFVKP